MAKKESPQAYIKMLKKLEKLFRYLFKKTNYNSIICPFCYKEPYFKEDVYFTDTKWKNGYTKHGTYSSEPSKSMEIKFVQHFCRCGQEFYSNYEVTGKESNKIIRY